MTTENWLYVVGLICGLGVHYALIRVALAKQDAQRVALYESFIEFKAVLQAHIKRMDDEIMQLRNRSHDHAQKIGAALAVLGLRNMLPRDIDDPPQGQRMR